MRTRWAVLLLAALVAALFAKLLFFNHVLCERDIYAMVYPQAESFARSIFSGSWPVWDPYVGFGQPMLANPGAQVFYPWTWLNLLFSPDIWYTIYAASHLLFSGVGVFLLARRLGLTAGGSLTAASLWIASGPLLSLINVWQHYAGAAWIPWVLLAADTLLRAPTVSRALLLAVTAAGQILAGSVDVLAMTWLLAAGYSLRYLRGGARGESLRRLGLLALAAALAVALTAAQWIPALDMFRSSSRPNLDEATRTYWSLPSLMLIQCVLPVFPSELPLKHEYRELLSQGREPFLTSLYLGLGGLPLVLAALCRSPRRRLVAFLAGAGLVAALAALGRNTLFYDAAIAVLPPLRVFRYPAKAMILAAFPWALLAGLGQDALGDAVRSRTYRLLLLLTLGTTALLGLVLLALPSLSPQLLATLLEAASSVSLRDEKLGVFRENLLGALLVVVAAFALVLASRRWPALSTRAGGAALAAVATLELVRIHHDLNYSLPRELLSRPLACIEVIPQRHLMRFFAYDEFVARINGRLYPPRLPTPAKMEEALKAYRFCMAANRWGMCGSYDRDPLQLYPQHLLELNQVFTGSEHRPAFPRLLRIGAVAYVFSLHQEGMEELIPVEGLPEPTLVYRVPETMPRTYVVDGTRVASDLDALRLLIHPAFDFRREIVLPAGEVAAPKPGPAGESQLVSFRPDRVRIEARLDRPGYVVLVDAYDPHWRVTVDGREERLLRANVAFRAVAVPAGRHLVEMIYRPSSLGWGLAVSGVSLLAGVGVLFGSRARP